jgi:hypothetical protein
MLAALTTLETALLTSLLTSFLISIPTSILTWIATEFLLKSWVRPKLVLSYDDADPFCRLPYGSESAYLRLRVTNGRYASAKRPRVYLMNVEEVGGGQTGFSDILPLSWAYETSQQKDVPNKPRTADLPLMKDTPDYADLCFQRKNEQQAKLGLLVDPFNKYAGFIKTGVNYKLTLQAVAEDAKPAIVQGFLLWDGTPDGLQFHLA